MSDLISRRALREILEMRNMIELYPEWRTLSLGMKEKIGRLAKAFRKAIDSAPTSDAVPVVHARWIFRKDPKHSYCTQAVCSACKHIAANNADLIVDNMKAYFAENNRFCRNCGARMDAKEND